MMKNFLFVLLIAVLIFTAGCEDEMVDEIEANVSAESDVSAEPVEKTTEEEDDDLILYVTSEEDFDNVIKENKLVVADFYADWCPPCKVLAPILEEVAADFENQVKVIKIDVDNNQELAKRFEVSAIPTIIYFKDGEIDETDVGAVEKETLIERFEALMQ
ncbi:MAG: thioredoxin [Candidatus Muiribacteriota bacterium]